jgi:hypothetical protein
LVAGVVSLSLKWKVTYPCLSWDRPVLQVPVRSLDVVEHVGGASRARTRWKGYEVKC